MLTQMATTSWPTSKKNRRVILADALLLGRGDPDSDVGTSFFSLASMLLGRSEYCSLILISYTGYTYCWMLKFVQFLFIT